MKKISYMIVTLILMFCIGGCNADMQGSGESKKESVNHVLTEGQNPTVEKLMRDWEKLLHLQEQRYAQENHALQKIMDIKGNNHWETYVKAQAVCAYTLEEIKYLGQFTLETEMSKEDYQELVNQGMDVGDAQAEMTSYNTITVPELAEKDSLVWEQYYLMNLMYGGCDKDIMNTLMASARIQYESNLAYLKYWYLVTNYIMLEIPEDYAEALFESIKENMPLIAKSYSQPFSDSNDVKNEINKVTNELEESLLEYQAVVTAGMAALDQTVPVPKEIEELPQMLLCPEGIVGEDWKFYFYWKEGDEIKTLSHLEEIESLPNCLQMISEGVSPEQYQQYIVELSETGVNPYEMTETAAMYQLENGGKLLICLDETELIISVEGGQVCFVPLWYIGMLKRLHP